MLAFQGVSPPHSSALVPCDVGSWGGGSAVVAV